MTVSEFLAWWMGIGPSHVVNRSWYDRDNRSYYTAQKMKFSIKDFFSKCD